MYTFLPFLGLIGGIVRIPSSLEAMTAALSISESVEKSVKLKYSKLTIITSKKLRLVQALIQCNIPALKYSITDELRKSER